MVCRRIDLFVRLIYNCSEQLCCLRRSTAAFYKTGVIAFFFFFFLDTISDRIDQMHDEIKELSYVTHQSKEIAQRAVKDFINQIKS